MSRIELSRVFPIKPKVLFFSWLDSDIHTAFTGSKATIDPSVGGEFTAWDGYIKGKNLKIEPYRLIVQSWRSADFPPDAPDSVLEVHLIEELGGTRLLLRQDSIPRDFGEDLRQAWIEYYLKPMQDYFSPEED